MGGSSPCTPAPGDFSRGCRPAFAENDPLDHFPGASALLDLIMKMSCRRCASGPAAESRQPGCKASGESRGRIRRESSLSLSDFPRLSMGQKPTNDRLPKQMADVAAFFPGSLFAKYGSRGFNPLAQVWGPKRLENLPLGWFSAEAGPEGPGRPCRRSPQRSPSYAGVNTRKRK